MALTDQKLSVLKAIGNMSRNTVSGAGTLQNLSTTVAELFITMLSSEGNDLEEIIPKMRCLGHMSSLAKCLSKIAIVSLIYQFYQSCLNYIWAQSRENLSSGVCEQQRADQPAHPRSLISAFVIHSLQSIISRLATSQILSFYLVSVAV